MGARKRTLDPGIWSDEGFLQLSDGARLFFIGLISFGDDEGRGSAMVKTLKARIFPSDGDARLMEIQGYKLEVSKYTHTVFYSSAGSEFYALLKWHDYQSLDHPKPSMIEPPEPRLMTASFSSDPAIRAEVWRALPGAENEAVA
jgi:hypothetical protein